MLAGMYSGAFNLCFIIRSGVERPSGLPKLGLTRSQAPD